MHGPGHQGTSHDPPDTRDVVNPARFQAWTVAWTTLSAVGLVVSLRNMAISPVGAADRWQVGVYGLVLILVAYPSLYVVLWRGMTTLVFEADAVEARTWFATWRGRPYRTLRLAPDAAVILSGYRTLTIRGGPDALRMSVVFWPQEELRRLLALAEARDIPVEYGWKPPFLGETGTRDRGRRPRP